MPGLDDVYVRVTLHAVSVEMRCKECGNGVIGIERLPADRVGEAIKDFENAAKGHVDLCIAAPHRPCEFDIVVTNADVSVN